MIAKGLAAMFRRPVSPTGNPPSEPSVTPRLTQPSPSRTTASGPPGNSRPGSFHFPERNRTWKQMSSRCGWTLASWFRWSSTWRPTRRNFNGIVLRIRKWLNGPNETWVSKSAGGMSVLHQRPAAQIGCRAVATSGPSDVTRASTLAFSPAPLWKSPTRWTSKLIPALKSSPAVTENRKATDNIDDEARWLESNGRFECECMI